MLDIFRKTDDVFHINPRFRAYGKARIDIAKRAETRDDWDQLWKKPTNPFPFSWGSSWKHCIEYKVTDFPAEVGFFIDILGFPVNAFDPDYAMFTSPNGDFYFSVVPTREGELPTPHGAIRLQFMVQDIIETSHELERRGVEFTQMPARVADNSSCLIGSFRTPNGIGIELWGFDARGEIWKQDAAAAAEDEVWHADSRRTEKETYLEGAGPDQAQSSLDEQGTQDDEYFGKRNNSPDSTIEVEYLNGDDY
jgi:catechol 2,3-dioxygenase-like lactoylglutathione lyase family enzyme